MGPIEQQLDKSVVELQKTLQMMKDKLVEMHANNAPLPDTRRVAWQITLLESLLQNNFCVGTNNIGEGDYQLKIAAKIADSYK